MKKYILVICCVAIALTCTGCLYKSWWGKRPCDQPGTEWVSEDGVIYFTINDNGGGVGTLKTQAGEIRIYVTIGPVISIYIYPLSNLVGNTLTEPFIELWQGKFKRDDEFTATVETTTYFEVGQKITFYKVKETEF